MGRSRAVGILRGADGTAFAMTWTPADALRAITWGSGIESDAEALTAVALAFSLDMVFIPAGEPWALDACARLAEEGVAVGWIVPGPFGRVADSLGWSEAIAESASEPGRLAIALDQALHHTLEQVRRGRDAAHADALLCADELAGAAGWLISPDFALEALMPPYRRIASEWGSTGPAAFHSDGDIRVMMPALADAGFSAIHFGASGTVSIERLFEAARSAGLVPIGGIAAQSLRAEGARATGEAAARLGSASGMVIADDGGMSAGEELAAYGVALDAARAALGQG